MMVLIAAFLGWMFDGFEMGIFTLVARPALMQMQRLSGHVDEAFVGHWMGLITALFLVGAALGGIVFGWLGDKIGRVRALTLSVLTYSIFSGLVYFATEPWHLGAARFVAALGMGGEWSLGVALVMEVWPSNSRSKLAGLIGVAGNSGVALIAVFGILFSVTEDSWRWVALVGTVPALLTLCIRFYVPESERWKKTAVKAQSHPVREVLGKDLWRVTLLACGLSSIALIGTWAAVQWLPLWADQMTGGHLPKAKAYTQVIFSVGSVVGSVFGAWLSAQIGRRWSFFLLSFGSLASCAVLFRLVDSYGGTFLTLSFVVGLLTGSYYGWLPLYLPELFPTRVRATGQGLCFNAGRVLAAVGAIEMGVLLKEFSGSYAKAGAVTSLVYAVGLVIIWFAPETKDRGIPE